MDPNDPILPTPGRVNDLPRHPDRPAYTPVPGQVTGGKSGIWILVIAGLLVVAGIVAGIVWG